jgi:nitroreductase
VTTETGTRKRGSFIKWVQEGGGVDLFKVILERRSIRSFKPYLVPDEVLRKLVEAGIWAPTGGNAQTWRFVIVTDPANIRRIKMLSPGLSGNPPAIVAICQDMAEAERRGDKLGREVLTVMDSALAAQNIMLAACAEGLGTCAIRSFHPGGVQKLLHLPESIEPQLLISVGVPEVTPRPPKRNFDVIWFQEYTDGE